MADKPFHHMDLSEFVQTPYISAEKSSARAAIPGMRWWCEPAVDLGPRICAECFNASAPGLTRCHSCIVKQHQREARRAEHIADLYNRRGQAAINDDVETALQIDDTLECAYNMPGDDRMTCYRCQSWCDHAHHPHTGARMTPAEWATYTADRPHIYGETS